MCLYRFLYFQPTLSFHWVYDVLRRCSPSEYPIMLGFVYFLGEFNFSVFVSLILGWIFGTCWGSRWSFGGQVVAKMEANIDAKSGVEKKVATKKARPR